MEWLEKSLNPFPQELNEIDWKSQLSHKNERLAQHLSAFSNYEGGGFLVFGVDNDGSIKDISAEDSEAIVNKLGNIARSNLVPPIILDHATTKFHERNLLIIRINESAEKPVHLHSGSISDSYTRSAGQTRKMDMTEIKSIITKSRGISFEDGISAQGLSATEVLQKINFTAYFDLLGRPLPDGNEAILEILSNDKLVRRNGERFDITNLGAILFAKNLEEFDRLSRKVARVIVYDGKNRLHTFREIDEKNGYASGFETLIGSVNNLLPSNEVVTATLRKEVKMYPEIAIRELVANALIHQDFFITGTGPMIELFSDRIEITNPGNSLIQTNRLLDMPPRSRNEGLASMMRRLKVCEEQGSGIDKVAFEAEKFQLPAPHFVSLDEHFMAVLYAYKKLSEMNKDERIRACYLHSCLKYVSGEKITNSSIRERFKIEPKNYPLASKIINETLTVKLIKPADPNNKSKRHSSYVPFWA